MSALSRFGLYVHRNAIAWDQLANTICGGNPDETLSSRAHKARERWRAGHGRGYLWGCILCTLLDAIWRDHCLKSCERDEGK